MILQKDVYLASLDALEDYVHNKAIVGNILWCIANEYGLTRKYVYFCTKDNIGKDVKPYWMVADI